MKYALFASGLSALLVSHANADERGDKLLRDFLTYQSKLETFSCELDLSMAIESPFGPMNMDQKFSFAMQQPNKMALRGKGGGMMSVDMVVVQRYFDKEQTGFYAAAGMIGRALIFFVGPMVAVMFPKVVKSHAEQKPTDVLRFTLLLTAGLCAMAIALGILVPDLPLRMVYDDSFLKAAPIVPWFIAAMAPLALAAVLVNNILARCKSKNVYLLLGVPVIYAGLLCYAGPQIAEQTSDGFNVDAHISMVGLIGMGNLCFLASTVILTWVVNQEEKLLLAQATENPPPGEAEAR